MNASSTSATVSDGSAAGAGASRSAAQPTPIWRWVSSPDSQATAAGVSAGSSRRSSSASTRDLAAARRGVAHGGRGLDELAQQHPRIVPPSAAVPSESYPQGPFVPPPDATELILVRHGASADAVPGEPFELIEGQSNPPLSPEGEAQARAVAERLAREPAGRHLHQHPRPHRPDGGSACRAAPASSPSCCPICARCTSASSRAAASASRWPTATRSSPACVAEQRWEVIPGAESSAALAARVRAAAEQVAVAVGPGAAAVVITHGGVIAELCRQATGSEPFAFLHVDNASITRIVVEADGRWLLRSFNDTTHLAGAAAGPPSRPPP